MYSDKLIKLIFPNMVNDLDYYEKKYPKRKKNYILRFAPSPTGFLHTGSLYTALINYKMAKDNDGIFYLRIEDTDTKRTVEGSTDTLKEQLSYFGIEYDNDPTYGPYFQSQRRDIYNAGLAYLLKKGLAYPCFLSESEIDDIRSYQEKNNLRTGIYKEFAKYRDISEEEAIKRIQNNESFVIRLKSKGNFNNKFKFKDELRGELLLPENDFDIVIYKQDKLPTYHFAHAIDDHFMGTTHVIRGEEWLTSAPIHVELFNALGFELPKYLHLDSIMKLDNGNKRKLSKRKDPEASVSYLIELGYPKEAIINYLLCLANSNYEEYFLKSKNNNIEDFRLSTDKMSKNGSLFDIAKLNSISKETIYFMPVNNLVKEISRWSFNNNKSLYDLIQSNIEMFKQIMSIGLNNENPRKEYERFEQIYDKIKFFYNSEYDRMLCEMPYSTDIVNKVCEEFVKIPFNVPEDEWLSNVKSLSQALGFAKNKKEKENLGLEYMFGDFMKIIRIKLCKSENSPSIYEILNILGLEEVKRRLKNV